MSKSRQSLVADGAHNEEIKTKETEPKEKKMVEVYPFYCCRTDGVVQFTTGGATVLNAPDSTKKPDAHTRSYSKLPSDNDRYIHWCVKVGELLKQEIQEDRHKDKIWMLGALPDGYTLWEHAGGEEGGSGVKKNGKERVDIYLYGHPGGKSRRFRSPGDFVPHLLWLCQGIEGAICKCKPCIATLKERREPHFIPGNDLGAQDMAVEDGALLAPEDTVMTGIQAPLSGIAPLPAPTLPSDTRSPEQRFDCDPNGLFMYRPGELVWFNKGSAWGLAVICRRQAISSIPHYLLQPLSHPLKHLPPLVKGQELIRPWLAWSVPSTTHASIANLTYDQVPWVQVLNNGLGPGDAEVDGSILAAKRVDASYTLFDRINMPRTGPGEALYMGMFLGAEKIWVGEPVRLRTYDDPNDDVLVLVLRDIIETTTGATAAVTLVGDIYKFVEIPTPYKSRSQWPTPNLPARMVSDVQFRNEVADNAGRGIWYQWCLLQSMTRRSLEEVRGRWHESKALLPILRGIEYQHDISKGVTSDAGGWMNGRGDGMSDAGQRRRNRLDAFGNSVPPDLKISRGFNGPPSENEFPMEGVHARIGHVPAHESQYGSEGTDADTGIENYLNLDHTGDPQGWMQR